jgi:hypothetical protein
MLLSSEDFEQGRCPDWAVRAYESFVGTLRDPAFPCYFGTQAERQGYFRYGLVSSEQHDPYGRLPGDLREFVALSRAHPQHRHLYIVFFDRHGDLPGDEERFWELLQWLHDHDPAPWPDAIPTDTSDPGWEFCFDGDPMFVFPSIPGYQARRSRRIGQAFAVCFQPRRIFAGVERGDPGGEAIRRDIYERVRSWDKVPPHPDLENLAYGDQAMREWKQYVLPDRNTALHGSCPLHIAKRTTHGSS